MLAVISNLQAKAGDFVVPARQPIRFRTSNAGLSRPSDGFYDAIKPATLAMIAKLQSAAGDRAPLPMH